MGSKRNWQQGELASSGQKNWFVTSARHLRPADYVIEVAPAVLAPKRPDAEAAQALLGRFHGQGLRLPARRRFLPDPEFLGWHREKWLGADGN